MIEFPCWCGFFNADYVCDEHLPTPGGGDQR